MVQVAVTNRGVKYVCHFTRIQNLPSILLNGIIPRETLENTGQQVQYNDALRIDGYKNANCLSLGHPNYKLFWRFRQENLAQEWVVIICAPRVIWEKSCAFCYENAASAPVITTPLATRMGVPAFEHLFSPCAGKPTREALKLPSYCPTNPQAEVLVFDTIEPEYIVGAVTNSAATASHLLQTYPSFQFKYHKSFFSARLDHAHW